MDEGTHEDVRKLLRSFGIRADETIAAYIAGRPNGGSLRLRVLLEDATDEKLAAGPKRLLEVEGEVRA